MCLTLAHTYVHQCCSARSFLNRKYHQYLVIVNLSTLTVFYYFQCLQLQEWVANNLCNVQVEVVYLLPKVSKFLLLNAEQLEQKYAKGLNNNEEKMTELVVLG